MSEYTEGVITNLELLSLDDVRERLGIKEISCSQSETKYLTSLERIRTFGESISSNINALNGDLKTLSNKVDKNIVDSAVKIASLQNALSENKHAVLNAVLNKSLSKSDAETIKTVKDFVTAGHVDALSSMKNNIDALLQGMTDNVKNAHDLLVSAETSVIAEKTGESLSAIGYDVKIKQLSEGLIIRGKKQDLSIAGQVFKTGELHIDMAGFEGGACSKEMGRLKEELDNRGIGFNAVKREYHGKKEGGNLIQKAKQEIAHEFNPLKEKSIVSRCRKMLLNSMKKKIMR